MAQQPLTQLECDITSQTSSGRTETLALIAILTGVASTIALVEFGYFRTDSPWMGALLFTFFWIIGIALTASRLQRFGAIRTRLATVTAEELNLLLNIGTVDNDVKSLAKEEKARRETLIVT